MTHVVAPMLSLQKDRLDCRRSEVGCCMHAYTYTHAYIYIYIYVNLSIYLSIYLSISLSLSLYIYISNKGTLKPCMSASEHCSREGRAARPAGPARPLPPAGLPAGQPAGAVFILCLSHSFLGAPCLGAPS